MDSLSLVRDRLHYNELVKVTAEQQLLLNIVRLRYSDTPSSLAVTSITSQTEVTQTFGVVPFLGIVGSDAQLRGAARLLPQGQISTANRPTLTMTPLDDSDFTRKLFTPMSLDGVVYLAKTTWPISTVFRLWLENINWVSNAESASGPTVSRKPDYETFLAGVQALQRLQDRSEAVFVNETRDELVSGPIPAARVLVADMVEASKNGMEFKPDASGATWSLVRRKSQPVLRIDPRALASADVGLFVNAFGLAPGKTAYDIVVDRLDPFSGGRSANNLTEIDLETRSLLQVLYFVAKGVDVPDAHRAARLVPSTTDVNGREFVWPLITQGLFSVRSSSEAAPPPGAHVAIRYLDHWFFLEKSDHASMATFSFLLELSRLESSGRTGVTPTLTLPLGGR